jgi:hypothetical protein
MSDTAGPEPQPTAVELPQDKSQIAKPSAASRVWASAELRAMVIDHMNDEQLLGNLCLEKSSFQDLVRALYRKFHYGDFDRLLEPSISVSLQA